MPVYHALVLNNTYAVIRLADQGKSDMEWERGVTTLLRDDDVSYSKLKMTSAMLYLGYEVVCPEDWQELIYNNNIGDDKYQKNRVYDKWDTVREIY